MDKTNNLSVNNNLVYKGTNADYKVSSVRGCCY